MKIKVLVLAILFTVLGVSGASAATIDLFQWMFNVNGTIYDSLGYAGSSTLPGNFNMGSFNTSTGLGTITVTLSGTGGYNFIGFFDHEIDQNINTYFNELGAAVNLGSKPANLSYETGEPGFTTPPPNIYTRTLDGALGNVIGAGPDDVAMALGWNFSLTSGQTGTITLLLSTNPPGSGFYLNQNDPDSPADIYFSSTLDIKGGGPSPNVPEPATVILLGSGLVGLIGLGRRKFRK